MKAIKLFACACFAALMASCGGGVQTKDLKVDTQIGGDQAGALAYSELIEVVDTVAEYKLEKVSKEDSGRAFDDQNWSVTVRINVKSDDCKDRPADQIKAALPELTLDVLNAEGKEIPGQSSFKLDDENLNKFIELLAKGAGAQGTIVFTEQTQNSTDCDKWFNEEAASVRIMSGGLKKGSAPVQSNNSSRDSSSGYDGMDRVGMDSPAYGEAMAGASPEGAAPEDASFEMQLDEF